MEIFLFPKENRTLETKRWFMIHIKDQKHSLIFKNKNNEKIKSCKALLCLYHVTLRFCNTRTCCHMVQSTVSLRIITIVHIYLQLNS